MNGILVLVFSVLGFLNVNAQILQDGQCNPSITLQARFDANQFLGSWYEIGKAEDPTEGGDCSSWSITADGTSYQFSYSSLVKNIPEDAVAQGSLQTGTAKFTLNYGTTENEDFWILGTNYRDYAIAYRCENVGTSQRKIYIWQLGRMTTISAIFTNSMNSVLGPLGINLLDLRSVDHSNYACTALPVIGKYEPVVLTGQCNDNITLLSDFDATKFVGTWHEIYSYYSESAPGECSRADYSLGDGVVNVANSQVVGQALDIIIGTATVADASTARLSVTLQVAPGESVTQDLWIISTDYINYAVSYSCQNIDAESKRVFSWIVSRDRQLSTQSQEAVNQVVDSILDLNFAYYQQTDQSDSACAYTPGQFVGECDLTIPAAANFQPDLYMGLWHDIESYSSGFQEGNCNNAFYTLIDGTVDVFNTQVIDQRLDTIRGVAVPVSTDGTAKLEVSFPIAGTDQFTKTSYWVLATDYTSYSIVYTCTNNNQTNTKTVFSWKLSRTKTLSSEANEVINNIISGIPVLDERFYNARDQSPEACFYFPDPQPGVPVVFPGECDNSISAVANFDLTQFLGEWYEIETYPKPQSGQCVLHEYTQGSNGTLNIFSSFLLNGFAASSTSVLELNSVDNSGKFTITINDGTQEVQIPFWILSTNYNDFAFAYSCMELEYERRAIYSWKLSRNRQQLSATAQTQIANVIGAVDVLDERYFETMEQDEEECVPLPEIPLGQPIILEGQCNPNIPVVQNFSAGDYLGKWYLIESYWSEFQNGACNDATYSLQDDGSVLVLNSQVINQTLDTTTLVATIEVTDGSGKLKVVFEDAPFPADYWILDTDYKSYSLVYSCANINNETQQIWSWKLSRTKTLTPEAVENIDRSISSIRVLNSAFYYTIDNSDKDCFYFPEPNGRPVVFRGQCDETIPVVTNFDAVAYMGLWYDIESYPQAFQEGSCSTAEYALRDGGVDVFNTQVVNQTLDTISGRAFLVETNDTQAKLEVTFPILEVGDVVSPYWVLATDYDNFAVVYSCENLDPETRYVSSWKLSRERALSTEAQQKINEAIADIDVLQQQYYEVKGHTDEQCFYYPEPSGEPVVFRGQCDNNIAAFPNFNLERFAGIWNEIETYPKEQAGGQCIYHEFVTSDASNTTLQLTSNQIVDSDRLISNKGQMVLDSTDGSGRFTLSINTENGEIVIPYWVLDTDYDNYALAYSCVNRNAEERAVYSWKLSRSSELSNTSNQAIDTAMLLVNVLQQQYFKGVSQTEDACFYLPDLELNEPVILPGQCDQSIPVVQNFSPGDYVGVWHLVETYWSEFQKGDCAEANYIAQEDGSVLVVNSEVINQTLDTMIGVATVASTDGSAKLSVIFPDAPVPIPYWVLDTDYRSFSLVYTCVDLPDNRRQVLSWKLSRAKTLSEDAINRIEQKISETRVLSNRYYSAVDNSDEACFYFPEPDGNPVTFRGQCDTTIPVVTNFDAVKYMGLWYDIESYPQTFQEGSCATAEYALRDGGVDVFNTQVVNRTLDTILGRAFLVESNDTEAKLEVTFPIAGVGDVFSPYWVLATDYVNFALVYACQNLDSERRSVTSWKLSRERVLSSEAQQKINEVIADIDVLQQQYYEVQGHTDEDCFYYPEPSGEPVVFRGQCDNNIAAFPNFNLERFAGIWNEIETYPKEQAGGQCIYHEFVTSDASNTTLQLTSNQIVDSDRLISNKGQMVLDSTDGSGRFTLSINTENGEIVIPYWVLDTDYDNYALAYSCVNRNAEERAVYSWKLSRSSELSNTSNQAIDTAMLLVNVLQQQYFKGVSQTEDACFYLPDLELNEPVILPGQCDQSIPVVQNFSPGDYVGVWHLVETYWSEFQKGDCAEANYIAQEDGSVLVVNSEVINQTLDTMIGVATVASTDGSAKLSVIFPDAPVPIPYWVLDTDYRSFSLVYTCVDLPDNRRQVLSWKLSRAKTLSEDAINRIEQKISETRVLSNRYYSAVDNSDEACFYFPEPDGNPVTFRGQCDTTIPVVTNFDAVKYMGLWYDIESYPQTFQEGSCATAEYALRDGGVDVFNTQVVNRTLDTILGRAFLVETNDTEAKLEVTFPIAGVGDVFSPYWVLATDYVNFALVYACQNLGSERRSVTSWKLSRERVLSSEAQQKINEVIADIDVLQQQYYEVQGHTDEDCFYYPEPSGEPVVFRGQCDNNIAAFPNIDLEKFSGLWNEIQTYPKDQVGGQCIHHDFTVTASNTTLQLTSNQVFNSETLVSNNGQVVLDSTDGSGRFSLTISTAGGEITIPYWILDTDYLNYALIYSCINRDKDTRAVYSWKLSRSKQLSSASNVAISTAMESVDVLQQQYFEDVSQTDQACFYLPEIGPNEPAIFPGQCDSNINAVTDFDANRFEGRWFDIESYYDDYEGTCVDGNFARTSNGFDVLFTQVVDQTLDSTFSTATLAADGSGRLIVSSNNLTFEYWILDTDYTNWALIYSCDNQGSDQRRVRSWKMSRTRQLTNEHNAAIDAIIDSIDVLNKKYFNLRSHSEQDCFYYPEPNGLPVTFRGRCDSSIQVVPDFNATKYLGQWYDIQSYPQFFQDGECASALYSSGDGVVDVFNTQVVNQELDTINGFAVVTSDDGSAKLDVTFVVDGKEVVTPYWVLATDYLSYSLVYSCSEIDSEYIRVAAWKLSRDRSLSNEAELVIDQVMSQVQVLDQQYFRKVDHSDEACFYYPDNNGGPVILDGLCPSPDDVNVVTNFDVDLFSGTWREFYSFPSERQEGECSFAEFVFESSSQVSLVENIVNEEKLITASSTGTLSADGRGVISLGDTQLFILDTDYKEFALFYQCKQIGTSSKQIYSRILSRSRNGLSQAATERIDERVTKEADLFKRYYEPTSQSNDDCFYYPEFENMPSFIEFDVPCEGTILGISNFDAGRYLGRWFEISRYPQPDQFGECAQATYSSGDGVVDVYNTQVVNRSLLVQEGSAVVSTTDGTGVLEVTFVVGGQTVVANYYVLATDYINYALVYSCRDLDNGKSQVFSWKLSRERSLSNTANQAINAIVANTRGLRNDYYIETSQSDESCFYVPEFNPDEPVLFRGQCQGITGMQNFNVQRYLGTWHEIERYPTGKDYGECVSSNFQSSTQVIDTKVFGDRGDISTTRITVTNDGRITRAGQGDMWVVDTDYETYAVLLSCEDNDEEDRQVWSAIHSRDRTLPESAENAISQVLEKNDLLYKQFYIKVDQSDEGCFYYPEVTEKPVVMPGQCDDDIPVVTDFAIAEYTGNWYQIERYPQFHETGGCTGARYSLDEETGTVTVLNWEVIDEELDTIEGTATVIANDDNGARFTVKLPSRVEEGEEVETNLYVLTTDYINYALAYSCQNIDQYHRQFGVWKLSRRRTLDSASDRAINDYMNQRKELEQRYFITVEQNEDCKEPNSSFLIKSSIILLLVCSVLQLLL